MDVPSLSARLLSDPPGVIDAPASCDPHVVVHVGPSVKIECKRGGKTHRGTAIHGDVDIVPAQTESRWTIWESDTALIVRIPGHLLTNVARESGIDAAKAQLVNRFQIRDPQVEQLAWALKAEMDSNYESGRLYLDSLGTALASRLLHRHSSISQTKTTGSKGGLPGAKLRHVLGYIEDNLGEYPLPSRDRGGEWFERLALPASIPPVPGCFRSPVRDWTAGGTRGVTPGARKTIDRPNCARGRVFPSESPGRSHAKVARSHSRWETPNGPVRPAYKPNLLFMPRI